MRINYRQLLLAHDVNTGGASSAAPAAQANVEQGVTQNPIQGAAGSPSAEGVTNNNEQPPLTMRDVARAAAAKHMSTADGNSPNPSEAGANANGAVLNKNATESNAPASQGENNGQEQQQSGEAGNKPPVAPEAKVPDEQLPFGKHPRFQELITQKNTLETQVNEFKPRAERMQQVEQFCVQHGVTPEEYDNTIRIAAMMKTDRKAALQAIEQIAQNLRYAEGTALPEDLQAAVNNGELSVDHAKEMLRLRVEAHRANTIAQQNQISANARAQQDVGSAINAWVSGKAGIDPLFQPKADAQQPDGKFELVNARFEQLCQQEQPKTIAQVISLADKAYTSVNALLGQSQRPANPVFRPLVPTNPPTQQEKPVDTSKPGWTREVAHRVAKRYT